MIDQLAIGWRRYIGVTATFLTIIVAFALGGCSRPAPRPKAPNIKTAPIFSDDFSAKSLDPLKWNVTNSYQTVQRTQWGHAPDLCKDEAGTTYARVSLSTFNPNPEKGGKFYLGTQFHSLDRWDLNTGIEYETRLRVKDMPPGLVLGFFAYGDAGVWQETYQKTETDFEFLTVNGGGKIWLHNWDNWNPIRKGPQDGDLYDTPMNWNDGSWNVYKIRWYPDRTEWIINDYIIRSEKKIRPGSPMGVWFNAWAPADDWEEAYDPTLKPAAIVEENKTFGYDVDYVKVRRILAPTSAPIGNGTGLKGCYYDTDKFTDLKILRLDPRIDFEWANYAPDTVMKADPFSVRWSGLIQPQHSEQYTFTANADDGVRLWVDNKLVLDNWVPQRPHPRSGKITLKAGVKVPIRLDYYHRAGRSTIQLYWSSASTPHEVVPQSQLYVEAQPVAPVFSQASRTLRKAEDVAITSATNGATIRYTLDGSKPDVRSPELKNGSKLRVAYTTLVQASAFLPNQVPSPVSRAYYVLSDKTPPLVAITSPVNGSFQKTIPPIEGIVTDDGSGVTRVDMVIKRLSDGMRWRQGKWVNEEWGLSAKIDGEKWIVKTGLPKADDLSAGTYELKAVAYDLAGNISGSVQTITIDNIGPTVNIDSPADGSTVTDLNGISGTARVDADGVGVARTELVVRRLSDGARWNGSRWIQEWNGLPTFAENTKWKSLPATLPKGNDLPNGRYQITAVSFDKLGNYGETLVTVHKQTPNSAAKAN